MKKWLTIIASLTMIIAVPSSNLILADTDDSAGNLIEGSTLVPAGDTVIIRAYFPSLEMAHKVVISFEAETLQSEYETGYLVMEVTQDQIAVLTDAGFQVKVDEQYTVSPLSIPSYPCYRTVEETFATAQDIVANYPNLATWTDVGDSWEKSAGLGGYDMMVLRLTNAAIPGPKPKLFMTGAIHAREYTTAELMTRFAEYLVDNYGSDADATWILDHHEIHLMFHANPDGRKKAETGLSWRKNTNQNYCGATSNDRGADLNRNFEFQWACCGGSSGSECNSTYRGPSPASEPETQAIQNYMRAQFPDQRGSSLSDPAPDDATGVYIDMHSHGRLVLWPWGFTSNVAPNGTQMQTLGRKFAYWNGHAPEQAIGLYPTDGTTDDFGYGDLGVASYGFELGTEFFESCSYFENTIVPDNMPSLIYAAKVARTPYVTPSGPDTYNLSLSQDNIPADTPVTLNGTLDDTRYNNSNGTEPTQNIAAAEYYVDVPPWVASPTPLPIAMSPSDGNFNSKIENVEATIDTTGWSEGQHTIFVRGQDVGGNWGAFSATFLTIQESPAVDVYMLVDLSGSFWDDLPVFKAQAPGIISTLTASNPNTRFGLGKFEDYPISPFGTAGCGDKAYERLVDLTFDTDLVLNTISGLFTRCGADWPQSQLPALYQAATGAGQDLSGAGFPGASIPAGQQANFRDGATKLFLLWTDAPFHQPGDPGSIPYPGPSFAETVDAILALDPPKVIGISSGGGGIADLEAIAAATDALAPLDGVDCDGDGAIDIAEGEPLVCGIASSGVGVGEAIVALVEAATGPIIVDIDIKPGSDPNSINCNNRDEVIAVAILTTEDFDATTVDHTTVIFEAASETHVDKKSGEPRRHEEDVDSDGDIDLVFHFRLGDTTLTCGSTEGTLTGETFDGQAIEGTDSVRMIGGPTLFAEGLWGPFGMAFDEKGALFVANEGDGGGGTTVSRVTRAGKVSTFASGFNGAAGVAFNSAGILHVSDDTNRIFRVSDTGELEVLVDSDVGLSNPNAIAIDANDNLYVVSCGGFVSKFDASGSLDDLKLAEGFNCPQSIVVDDSAGAIFISDMGGNVFQIDKETGEESLYVETSAFTEGGLAMDSQGNLYLSAYSDGLVLRIDASDLSMSTCLSGIHTPRGLVFDSAGRLYVTSYENDQILRANRCEP